MILFVVFLAKGPPQAAEKCHNIPPLLVYHRQQGGGIMTKNWSDAQTVENQRCMVLYSQGPVRSPHNFLLSGVPLIKKAPIRYI